MMNGNFMEKLLDGVEIEWKSLSDISEIYGGLSGKTKDEKIKSCIDTYDKMKSIYLEILNHKEILKLIKKFKEKFKLQNIKNSNAVANVKIKFCNLMF